MTSREELIRWLKSLPDDPNIGIDEDGLTLVCNDHRDLYFEIGGLSEHVPVTSRPELTALLSELRRLDRNGWAIATDSSLDHLTTEEAIKELTETIAEIKKG